MAHSLDRILKPLKNMAEAHRLGRKDIGYNDVKDYLDRLLRDFNGEKSGVTGVVLFGSVSRGEAGPESDIDLMFLTEDEKKTRDEIERCYQGISQQEYGQLLGDRNLDLSPIIVKNSIFDNCKGIEQRRTRGGFTYNVADNGIILYDRDGRTKRTFDSIRSEPHIKNYFVP